MVLFLQMLDVPNNWEIDFFHLDDITGLKSLSVMGYTIFKVSNTT